MKKTMLVLTGLALAVSGWAAEKKIKTLTDDLPGLPVQSAEWWAQHRQELAAQEARGGQAPAGVDGEAASVNFYTGKPYDSDLGAYVFKYRNYSPEMQRWLVSDPSGFPDGANNYCYVNNKTINSLDPKGTNIYTITNPTAVSGAGHAAVISGNGNSYKYQSYGAGSSKSGSSESSNGNNLTTKTFDSLSEAMQYANSQGYQNVNEWQTTPAQDADAQEAANQYANTDYNLATHNCQNMVNDALNAAGVENAASSSAADNIPNTMDKLNRILADAYGKISKYE